MAKHLKTRRLRHELPPRPQLLRLQQIYRLNQEYHMRKTSSFDLFEDSGTFQIEIEDQVY